MCRAALIRDSAGTGSEGTRIREDSFDLPNPKAGEQASDVSGANGLQRARRQYANLNAVEPKMTQKATTKLRRATGFLAPRLHQVLHFLAKQGIAMAGNLVYGLCCVRMLPKPDYAMFAVLFGFMGSLTVLQDIGISGTLAPLIGEQIDNLPLIANYVASLRRIAMQLYFVAAPVAAVIFTLLVRRQHWGYSIVAQMLCVLLVTAWFARVSSSYGAVLILRRDRSYLYRIQMIGSLGSLALLLVFWALHCMNVYVGILLNVAQVLFTAFSYYRRARQLLGVKGHPEPEKQRAIVRLAMPNFPASIFYAVQGQITLMLITAFGHNAASVANVGALARLGQILVLFAQMNPILVEPFFARLQAARLARVYLGAVVLVTLFAAAFTASAFLFPQLFLWVLGDKYGNLRFEVGLQVLSSSLAFVSGFLWVINSSRRFVYWWNTVFNISLTVLVQAIVIWKVDLSSVSHVLFLNVASATASLLVCISCGVYGFWRGPQKMETPGN